ncbi:hypothetical protein D3C71_153370 [compost metagenome]
MNTSANSSSALAGPRPTASRRLLGALKYLPLFLVLTASEASATRCFEYLDIPESLDCTANGGNSADFTNDCKRVEASQEVIEVACPFRWVSTDGTKTHAQVCQAEGLKTTSSVSAEVCSSGERRAPDTYNFIYGKWGGVSSGGIETTSRNGKFYCWGSRQKKDYDRTDIITAYPCTGQ